ncbi:MAG: Riboflavin biosynthesis protein RibD [Moorella sp. 60_41]|nr:MAG: Riboflavin biosynthesis protein RibD [Moorella sp. 60_41]
MRRALELARKGLGRTSPNPAVGAVVVRDGEIVGEGYHERAGTPHAEAHALREARDRARGSTLYVTLEPCCHHGKTPPCTEAIIGAGIKKVVAAMVDPNPKVAGRGLRRLQEAGVEVEVGLLEKEARRLNEAFIKYITTGLPWVTLKMALTLDGKIATRTGAARWITCEESRRRVHELRNTYDAVLVGIGTVLADDPQLTARLPGGRDPVRVILDSRLRLPLDARLVNVKSGAPTVVATTEEAPRERREELVRAGIEVMTLPAEEGRVSWPALLEGLARRRIISVLIEGGAEVNGSALAHGVVDRVIAFIAPKLFGGREAPGAVGGLGVARPEEAWKLEEVEVEPSGEDIMVTGLISRAGPEGSYFLGSRP